MTYNEQIKALIDEVRPQFELLGMYAFHGEGEPEEVTNAFVIRKSAMVSIEKQHETIETVEILGYRKNKAVSQVSQLSHNKNDCSRR